MKRATILFAILLSLVLVIGMVPQAQAGEVAQGPCLQFNKEGKSLTIENELDKKPLVFDLSQARIGANPESGHVLRIAYKVEGGKNIALKVMNVTRQNLMKE
jgi:hypothetical protein